MVLKEEVYKGMKIYTNLNEEANTVYHTVYNARNDRHVHISNATGAHKIVDCFVARNRSKFGRAIRNKAMRLEGFNVFYK